MKTLCVAFGMMAAHFVNAQANTSLGNLTNPTVINQSLLPAADATKNLGSISKSWDSLYVEDAISINTFRLQHGANLVMSTSTNVVGGIRTTIIGSGAGASVTSASDCTFIGSRAGASQNSGLYNTFIGSKSGENNLSGGSNTCLGAWTGVGLSTGSNNVFMGVFSGLNNTIGNKNSGIGTNSLFSNISGNNNVALGYDACRDNNTGSDNTAVGNAALANNQTGFDNVAIGSSSLPSSHDSNSGVFVGTSAGSYVITSQGTVSVGYKSAQYFQSGSSNTFLGSYSGVPSLIGTLDNSTAVGYQALFNQSNQMSFGNVDVQRWMFGRTSMTANRALQVGTTTTNGNGASLTTGGTWTNASSRSFKSDLQKLDATEILSRVNKLELTRWKYNETNEYHIGPMAEQFHELFNVGVDNVSVSTIDPAGVALVSIQALSQNDEEISKTLQVLQNENEELKTKLNDMQQCLERMCDLEEKLNSYNNAPLQSTGITRIAPNPSNEVTFIHCNIPGYAKDAAIVLTDGNGKNILENKIKDRGNQRVEINTSSLQAGTYVCMLLIDQTVISSSLMIVTH